MDQPTQSSSKPGLLKVIEEITGGFIIVRILEDHWITVAGPYLDLEEAMTDLRMLRIEDWNNI